jgi:predicted dehydrogenase
MAIIGAGFWARYQLAAWFELPDVRCLAVCDRDIDRARSLAAAHNVPAVYNDVTDMLHKERLDFVDIVTSVASHVPLVKLVADYGVPVICQKPLAATFQDCQAVVSHCQRAGVLFAIHENWRWQAPLRHVRDLLRRNAIGEPFRCRIDMISGFDVFANQPNLKDDAEFIIADMGCHLFDLARSYFGEVERVYCQTGRVHADIRGEDVATALLTMNGGRVAVEVNMAYAGTPLEHECFPQTMVFVEGDTGSLEVAPGGWVRVTTSAGTHAQRVLPPKYSWVDPDYAMVQASIVDCHADILRSLRSRTSAETDAADNLRTMRVVFAAYESARGGQAIAISSERTGAA